mmetsp:Transcript_9738/g.36240  ORF Transcript_9738/g.36240 Transcript_9738/m.36240 type:complete len:609 (-) Transcript_9738:45-1871(-)
MSSFLTILLSILILSITFNATLGATVKNSHENVLNALAKDNFLPAQQLTYKSAWSVLALSKNVTLLSDKSPKSIVYVEAESWYDFGYILSQQTQNATNEMLSTYLDHVIATMISKDFDKEHKGELWYEQLLKVLTYLFKTESVNHWKWDWLPEDMAQEMKGWIQGMKDAGYPYGESEFITLNYGFDFLLSQIYGNLIGDTIKKIMVDMDVDPHLQHQVALALEKYPELIRVPVYCDSFTTKRSFNKDPSEIYFARDFQLPVGRVYQKYETMIIYNPKMEGYVPFVSVVAPGMIGSITGFNAHGVAIGVDVMRSGYSTPQNVGINSILMVKNVAMRAKNTARAIDVVVDTQRGCPWFYPISDSNGESVVLAAGASTEDYVSPLDLLTFWEKRLKNLLPSKEYLEEHSKFEWRRGVFVRRSNYTQPGEFVKQFNEGLLKYSGISINSTAWEPTGYVFSTWQDEKQGEKKLMNNYFSPMRTDSLGESSKDMILVSNHAFIPQARISQMTPTANFLSKSQEMTQWRYDALWDMLRIAKGSVDMEKAWEILTFLSPDRTPGYWSDYLYPDDPMSAVHEGTITLIDMKQQIIRSKGGYWKDDYVELHLKNYFEA